MTQKDKDLLLKDLCARLPYHPILNWKFIDNTSKDEELKELSDLYIWCITKAQDCEVKPYLRSMSSMTEEEKTELFRLMGNGTDIQRIDFYLSHCFDFRCLIPMGLALEAPEEMYKDKTTMKANEVQEKIY